MSLSLKNFTKEILLGVLLLFSLSSGARILADEELIEHQDKLVRQHEELSKIGIMRPAYFERTKEEYLKLADHLSNFGMYCENYIITGIPTNKKTSNHTADAKFQFSIRHRITRTSLSLEAFMMITYSQKSFWNIYENSSPFRDNNYNPGIAFFTPIIRNNHLIGMSVISIEHESNSGDSIDSRGWDFLGLSFTYFFNMQLSGQIKVWPAIIDGEYNKDLYDYKGYGMIALSHRGLKDKVKFSSVLNPRKKFSSVNTQIDFCHRINKKTNVYFFAQRYNGYGEGLLDYNKYRSMVRVGLSLRPDMLIFY
ncbi:MAG: phospholipase A [Prevotellaceae bacterium]|nr:phospholipase A [Prevotellaceae bacterium]